MAGKRLCHEGKNDTWVCREKNSNNVNYDDLHRFTLTIVFLSQISRHLRSPLFEPYAATVTNKKASLVPTFICDGAIIL